MYLRIGMNRYLWSGRIVGIFPRAGLDENHDTQPFPAKVRIVSHKLPLAEVKTVILTDSNELHWSNVNYRTLRQRWQAYRSNFLDKDRGIENERRGREIFYGRDSAETAKSRSLRCK